MEFSKKIGNKYWLDSDFNRAVEKNAKACNSLLYFLDGTFGYSYILQ